VSDDVRDQPFRRTSYDLGSLDEAAVAAGWLEQFRRWWEDAEPLRERSGIDRSAVVLATVDPVAGPSARTVLVRGFDDAGFVFHTNRLSRKGRELTAVPKAALCWQWLPQERQIRVDGVVSLLSDAESDAYFASRPRGSQLGAWASPQSQLLAGRDELMALEADVAARFEGADVPRPPFWGGYLVRPTAVEFWQGRPDRLHDRIRFRAAGDEWIRERLAP
jgi:pyridoxamine 5'-phosphate oxidase